MNNNYYRITGYCPENDFSFILDSNGMFEKLWEFSAYLIAKGLDVIEVTRLENIIDININQVEEDKQHMILRANADGKPEYVNHTINGITYRAIKVADKLYIINK
ncbi:MAG: hypothetical protein J6J11_01950 [Treponema sp.]|nr:hypothetical protein [Clostridia bacterium]MBO5142985.1 hypothetical protein [Clostridia bacterium]MBP3456695.1 hypothetical protein [Bacilli bacterium]MBP3607068.1 hypothetical protein [Treponema sp.]MBR4003760.1 hypothetical protein [Clostridia bacterium]